MSPRLVAGVDEAGRGPLAGPVAVAAVILDPARPIAGLDDSKKLTPRRREQLEGLIIECALAWHVALVHADEVDRINILQATFEGMRRCVHALRPAAELVRVDGHQVPPGLGVAAEALVGGDGIDAAIGAASILAKVARDRWMLTLHAQHPGYGFDRHKGYPSPAHLDALARLGPCPAHRLSFAPVRRARDAFAPAGGALSSLVAPLPRG